MLLSCICVRTLGGSFSYCEVLRTLGASSLLVSHSFVPSVALTVRRMDIIIQEGNAKRFGVLSWHGLE